MPVAERTHEVLNQPPPLADRNAFDADRALREALEREGGAWGFDRVRDVGAVVGSSEAQEHSNRAHVVRAAMFYLLNSLDTGPCCPMSINYAAVPTLRQDPELAAEWEPRIT